jgi:transcriptional regulator with XRE-family HTH domain
VSDWKSNRLRVLRAERRLSQDELAAKLGVSQAQYSKLERGFAEPNAEQRKVLARVFKVRVSALTSGALSRAS